MRNLLINYKIKGHKRDCSIVKGLKDKVFRHIIANRYTIVLLNREICDRHIKDKCFIKHFLC
jgi:hypothetical protein